MKIINTIGNIFLSQIEWWWFATLFLFGWVWTNKTDNVDTVDDDHINRLQNLKVDTDEVPILQNILGGSDFGTWSQSDANKGRGTLTYDNKTGTFQVGEAINNVAYISANLQFNDLNPDTITDALNGFLECQFMAGDTITVAGTVNNDGNYTINTVVAGTITLDIGDVLVNEGPVVCTITSTTVIATGKLITDIASVLTLGACDGRFRDDDGTYAGWIVGATSGATATVNMPDAAIGVDLVQNGEFADLADDPPPGWVAVASADLDTEANGQIGNCLEINENGEADPCACQYLTGIIEPGKIYKFSFYVKQGTEATYQYKIYDITGAAWIYRSPSIEAGAAWTRVEYTFEAPIDCVSVGIFLYQICGAAAGTTIYFDEITFYEITPCCTGADALAWDGDEWTKDTTLDLYRDGGTNTKEGSFYALKCVPSAADDYINWRYDLRSNAEHLARFYGKTAAVGMWVKTSTASHFRICMYEGGGTSVYSSYHTGGGAWEWIEVPITYLTTGTYIYMQWRFYQPANVNGSTIVYISQPMLVFHNATDGIIGEGNYSPKPQEVILCKKKIPSNLLDGQASLDDVAVADLNLEADSDAMLPKGCKAVKIFSQCNDAGSAGADCYLRFRADATKDYEYYNSPYGLANDCDSRTLGWQQCDQYGDIDYNIEEAGGASGFDIDQMDYVAVQVN